MQHINHNTTHLQNVNIYGLISKHPFITDSKIYNNICIHSFTELCKQTPHTHLTGHVGYQHPSLRGVQSLLASPSHRRCGWSSCTCARAAPCKPPCPHRTETPCEAIDTHSGVPAYCPWLSLAGWVPFPPASQGRRLNPARAGWWCHRMTSGSTKPGLNCCSVSVSLILILKNVASAPGRFLLFPFTHD